MAMNSIFDAYAMGKGVLDGRTFVKLCKECELLDKKNLTSTDCDLIFSKITKVSKRMTFDQFEAAVNQIADKKKCSVNDVVAKFKAIEGPTFTGTATEAVRFYDDKDTFTGVHRHGGPTTVDKPSKAGGNASNAGGSGMTCSIGLADICDRSASDIRGVNKNFNKS